MNKLELTWVGKDTMPPIEPRILIHDSQRDYGNSETENMLIHGDNLLALKALEQKYSGQVKCIYIDPPYNTGAACEHYDDNLEHSIWLGLMNARLKILRNLLAPDGSIFVQIDDEEYAYLKVVMDEIFGRKNYINTISVMMKNIAGASGGGEDKRLKKNIEYIVIYTKDYDAFAPFSPVYSYKSIAKLIDEYKDEGKSWKYTSALINPGAKTYVGSTQDGDGNEIKIYRRDGYVIKSLNELMQCENLSIAEVYRKYAKCFFQTAMPQSSIRPRVMDKVREIGMESDVYSIEYVPKSGRNRGKVYEQFYKGESFRLFAWLSDVSEERDGILYKKDLRGTYWDFVGETKNLTKEGNVEFPKGKKAERLIKCIFDLATEPGDLVLDSFLGSGTTAAVATKMGRRWIAIELGEHCYTHCVPRLNSVIDGTDNGGITSDVDWQGGGGYHFYELAPTLLNRDSYGEYVINKEYNADALAAAVALHEGFTYKPDKVLFWKQSVVNEKSYLFVTTRHLNDAYLKSIRDTMKDDEHLIIACRSYDGALANLYENITLKKIPQMLLDRCEFGRDDYSLNIVHPPIYEDEEEYDDE